MTGPLDLMTPARHIATEIERAAPAALSVSELAASYRHPNTGDVSRAISLSGAADEAGANRYLIEHALEKLSRNGKGGQQQVVEVEGGYRFADGITFDDLRFDKKKLTRRINPHERLGDPFHPMTGQFSDNVRGIGDLTDLRESMREHGWIEDPIFDAISDERGVILVGHRRIAVAKELGIEPRIRPVKCGDGDQADVKRFQYALLSNIGRREMTKAERQKIVAVLAGPEHDWTQTSIAAALGVSQSAIRDDIAALKNSGDLVLPTKSGQRQGRPPGTSTSTPKNRDPELLAFIRERLEGGEPAPSQKELKERFGAHESTSQVAIARVETELEIRAEYEPDPSCSHRWKPVEVCDCGAVKAE